MPDQPLNSLIIVALISLCVGSFLNVLIYRLPIMLKRQWRADSEAYLAESTPDHKPARFNLVKPNSTCPRCGHAIKPWENIPVISYLALRGRCSACKTPISPRYPLIELATALLSALPVWIMGVTPTAFAAVGLIWVLVALTMIDFDEQLLPDNLTLPLLWIGLLINTQGLFCTLEDAVWGAVAGYMTLWSVFWLFKLLTGKEGMGYGDFKLLAALGAWLGWQALPVIILGSSLVGAVVGIIMIVTLGRDRQIPIPFGPYLSAAGLIALLWGQDLTNAYLRFSGLQ